MTDKQLTANFKLSEFIKEDPNPYQLALIQKLADNLQRIRDMLQEYAVEGKTVSISISSGIRTSADYDRLKSKGYNPSKTSDHFCGLQLLSKPTLGAADLHFSNCKLTYRQIAAKIIEWNENAKNDLMLGQVIYEKNPATGSEWVHVGNDWYGIYETDIAKAIDTMRKRYLMSLDNGRSYTAFKES